MRTKRSRTCLSEQERGECPVYIDYTRDDAKIVVKLNAQWDIKPTEKALEKIQEMLEQPVNIVF